MSGKDERLIKDIPVCPICGRRPDFWILDVTKSKWFWLPSDEWLDQHTSFAKVTYNQHVSDWDMDHVQVVRCGYGGYSITHKFSKDSFVPRCMVRECINQAKYYLDIGEVKRNER